MKFKDFLLQSLLIVFSVLFALFINRLAEGASLEKKKALALERIELELNRNSEILKDWNQRHEAIGSRLTAVLENPDDTLRAAFLNYGHFEFGVMTEGKALIDEILTNTAWEAARTTEIIAEFDYELVEKLTRAYVMQGVMMEKTVAKILDLYFDASTHDLRNFEGTLLLFQLRFQELNGQERLLQYLYEQALADLEKKKK